MDDTFPRVGRAGQTLDTALALDSGAIRRRRLHVAAYTLIDALRQPSDVVVPSANSEITEYAVDVTLSESRWSWLRRTGTQGNCLLIENADD